MNEINFQILNTFRDPATGFVKNVAWLALIADLPSHLGVAGNTTFIQDQPSITPYAEITQEQVIEWVKNKLGTDQLNTLHTVLQGRKSSATPDAGNLLTGLPPSATNV
jgi:hypothetical protein